MYDEAENAFKKAIESNPGDHRGYDGLGDLYWMKGDYERQIKNKLKALQRLKRTSRSYDLTYYLSYQLYALGFFPEGLKLAEELIIEYGDSTMYYLGQEAVNMNSGNYKAAYENGLKTGRNFNLDWWCKGNTCLRLSDFKGALTFIEGYYANGGQNVPNYYFGYTYFKNGLKEKAAFHFNGVINEQQKIIKANKGKARGYAYYTLVCTYSAMGDKAKAVETMKKMLEHKDEIPISPVTMLEFRNHPMCDAIKDTPEQKEILRIAEENFQPVKKKIEKLLREAGY
jgi:tetratricopeptide (TPR) repeat protein